MLRFDYFYRLIFFSALMFVQLPALAQSDSELYAGEVSVGSKSDQDRVAALGLALRQVIGKLTGLANPESPVVDEASANAQNYLQQFQYRGQETDGSLKLWARFNAQAMDATVVQAGLPQWSRQRPPVLTWIALRGADSVELFNLEDPGGLAQAIRKSAWKRGLSLEFPLLDLEDRGNLSADDVWGLYTVKLLKASQRYSASRIFIARIEHGQGELWTAKWTLLGGEEVTNWSSQGTSMEAVVAFGLNTAADRIARREVVNSISQDDSVVQISISGIRNLSDYARGMKYLRSLEQVTNLETREMRGDEMSLLLSVRGGAQALSQLVSFGDVLMAQGTASAEEPVLYFSLKP